MRQILTGDGWQDLFVANVDHELYSVYINNKDETFHDASEKEGVARDTRLMSGWGLKYFDYDNDGRWILSSPMVILTT